MNLGSRLHKKFPQQASDKLFQPRVLVITETISGFLQKKKTTSVYPLDAQEVFISEQEAIDFLPIFLNKLVREKMLDPAKLFLENNALNENYVKTAIVPLSITRLELDAS